MVSAVVPDVSLYAAAGDNDNDLLTARGEEAVNARRGVAKGLAEGEPRDRSMPLTPQEWRSCTSGFR